MNTTTRISIAERLGRSVGCGWRAYARGERRTSNWLVSKGVPATGAAALLWVVKLVSVGLLFYAAFWLAVLVGLIIVMARIAAGGQEEPTASAIGDQVDRKGSVFYDPRNYNDDPDPRFDDH